MPTPKPTFFFFFGLPFLVGTAACFPVWLSLVIQFPSHHFQNDNLLSLASTTAPMSTTAYILAVVILGSHLTSVSYTLWAGLRKEPQIWKKITDTVNKNFHVLMSKEECMLFC